MSSMHSRTTTTKLQNFLFSTKKIYINLLFFLCNNYIIIKYYLSTFYAKKKKKTDKFTPLNPKIIKLFLFFLIKLRKKFRIIIL